jgi:hypothetical protein
MSYQTLRRKVVAMTQISTESRQSHRKVRGREKRNMTLNTKLTELEFAEVERFCESNSVAFGEWVREVVLREIRGSKDGPAAVPLLSEITGLRLLLINTLEPLLRGEKMTPEQFKEMLRYVKTNKRKAAVDMLASYAEGITEQP